MNRAYKSVWNEALGAWVAASELTKARGKKAASLTPIVIGIALLFGHGAASATCSFSEAGGSGQVKLDATSPDTFNSCLDRLNGTFQPLTFAGDSGTPVARNLGTTLKVQGGVTDPTKLTDNNIGVVANGTDTLTIKLAKDLTGLSSAAFVGTGVNTLVNGGGIFITPTLGNPVSLSGSGLDNGGNKIVNVGNGTVSSGSKDAINGSQLYAVKTTSEMGWNVTTGQTGTGTVSGSSVQKVAPGDTVTFVAGDNIAITQAGKTVTVATNPQVAFDKVTVGPVVIDKTLGINAGSKTITNVAAGAVNSTSTDAINGSQLYTLDGKLTGAGLNFTDAAGTNKVHVDLGGTLPIIGATTQAGGLALSTDTPTVGSYSSANVQTFADKSNGRIQVQIANAPVFSGTVTSATGFQVTGGPSMTTTGIDAASKKITNVAAGVSTTDAVNVGQLNTLGGDLTNSGLNFAGNSGSPVHRNLGQTLNIVGVASTSGTYSGANLKTVTDPETGAINLQLADSPKFGSVVVNDSGTGKITGVTAGSVTKTSTDAINGSQLYAVQQTAGAGWNLTAQGANSSNIAPGATVDLRNGDGNIVVSKPSGTGVVTFDLAKNIMVDSVNAGGTLLNKSGLTVGGTTVTSKGLVITGGPSVTTTGIDAGGKVITNVAAGVNTTDAVNVGQLAAAQTAATTKVSAGTNMVVTPTLNKDGSTTYEVATAKEVVFDKTTVGGVVTNGATNKISGLAAGEVSSSSTEAVNGSQLYAVQQTAGAGWNLSANGDKATNVTPGGTMTVQQGSNITVTRDGGDPNKLTLGVVAAPTFAGTVTSATGFQVTGGPSVTAGGIDAAGKKVTNVADGEISGTSKDAINGRQLFNALDGIGGELSNRIDNVDRNARGGIAAAMATAGLPQVYQPGKSMVAAGGSTYRGQTGFAVGLSTLTDDGKWLLKGSINGSGRGHVGGTVAAGYQW